MIRNLVWVVLCGAVACTGEAVPEDTGTAPETIPDPVSDAGLTEGGVLTCTPSGTEKHFTEMSQGDWAERGRTGPGYGLTVADFNGDGHLDLVAPMAGMLTFYLGDGEGNLIHASEALPPEANGAWRSVAAADLNGDGHMDFLATSVALPERIFFWQPLTQTFATPAENGLVDGEKSVGSAFGDLDGDGDLDVAVASGSKTYPQGIYENVNGVMVHRPDWAPSSWTDGHTFLVGVFDLSGDFRADLYRVNDILGKVPNLALINTDDGLKPAADSTGLNLRHCGMGLGVNDINHDGRPDLAMSDCENIILLESRPNYLWIETSTSRHLDVDYTTDRVVPWGMEMADFDNDGLIDVMAANGYVVDPNWDIPEHQPIGLHQQQPDGSFIEIGDSVGLDEKGSHRGFVLADFNEDGMLDLIAQDLQSDPKFFLGECNSNAWMQVDLFAPGPNTRGVGAEVKLITPEKSWTQWIRAGAGTLSSGNPMRIHFGLGDLEQVDMMVTWVDGTVQHFYEVPTKQFLKVEHPGLLPVVAE